DGTPIVLTHFTEQAVASDAGIVDQHRDGPMLGLDLLESGHGGVPIGDIAHRSMEFVSQLGLFAEPLLIIAAWAAAGDDRIAFFGEALAYRGADTSHSAR